MANGGETRDMGTLPIAAAALVPILARHQFVFHMVVPGVVTTTAPSSSTSLVMTRWLPESSSLSSNNAEDDTPPQKKNRLPKGPTHQVGVGCLVYKPGDANQILVVQEKSGPAAFHQLWKMPTGLIDANEDIHEAAIRELYEETGLCAHSFDGLICLRQAPLKAPQPSTTTSPSGGGGATNNSDNQKFINSRKAADLFFVCRLTVADVVDRRTVDDDENDVTDDNDWSAVFRPCPDEIAAIRWMNLADFVRQPLWQASPLYRQLNRILLQHDNNDDDADDDKNSNNNKKLLWTHSTLSIRHDMPTMKNTLYHPVGQKSATDDSSATTTTAPSSAL
jgi:8-oxo-dGTP pyrophosphatase MutT (NUDIX family)